MRIFLLYFNVVILLLCSIRQGDAAILNYTFVLQEAPYSRLCSNKTILTINGTFPGPTIYAKKGDLVVVDVHNKANHNITIHWHGVKMPRYPWADGPEYVTQCPITPNTSFRQKVILSDEEGTLWWHAHSEWSRATVYGAFVILPNDKDQYPFLQPVVDLGPILLGDWWKSDVQEVMEEFLRNGGDPNVSDAFLMNGQPGDLYPCSRKHTFKLKVKHGKTYLVRLINAVMNNIMFFKIANHTITVVGSDASYTKQINSDYITISPGQTIDFLLHANQTPGNYYMASRVYASAGLYDNTTTTGIIEYVGNHSGNHVGHHGGHHVGHHAPPPTPLLPTFFQFNDTFASVNFTRQLRSLANKKYPVDVPSNVTDKLFFTLSINTRSCPNDSCVGPNGGRFLASVNNLTLVLPKMDILQAYYNRISGIYETGFPDNPPFPYNYTQQFVPQLLWTPENGTDVKILEYNSVVEIVFQGTNTVAGIDHPMHLHGYSFYVVGSGLGNFNKSTDPLNYNLVDPPLMETIAVPVNGWTAIRFRANNPGVWFMHCHFERHVSWGMGMTFIVKNGIGQNETMLPPPGDMPKC